ncbi:MAG TPA: DUF302 domain-containing protein [Desulfuromonadales bacterium]|nr:DUF302 domain-containing protein [Desulfuromonadales bacterium]
MSYCFSKIVKMPYNEAIAKVTAELQKEGFGILTEIDVKDKLKEKIKVDFRNYIILGACNPSYAYKALQEEPHVGTMLPCNVVVQQLETGEIEVSAIDPLASMMAIDNKDLVVIANEIQTKLKKVIDAV